MMFLSVALAFLALNLSASASKFKKVPLPDEIGLVYPTNSVSTGTTVLIGVTDAGWDQGLYSGVYVNVTTTLTHPDGGVHRIGSVFNYNPSVFNTSLPQPCNHSSPPGNWTFQDVPILLGTYTIQWNTTWTFPLSVDTSGSVTECTGAGSSESFLIERSFNVTGTLFSATTVSAVLTTDLVSFSQQPTGTVYLSAYNAANRRSSVSSVLTLGSVGVIALCLYFVL